MCSCTILIFDDVLVIRWCSDVFCSLVDFCSDVTGYFYFVGFSVDYFNRCYLFVVAVVDALLL